MKEFILSGRPCEMLLRSSGFATISRGRLLVKGGEFLENKTNCNGVQIPLLGKEGCPPAGGRGG